MNRINRNNLENLKALYGAYNAKKAVKEEKQETVEEVKEFKNKKVDANALDILAAQNKAAQFTKVDTSDAAVQKRLEQAFTNSAFMKSLDDLFGENKKEDFVDFAKANITGVNHEKLAKYLAKPLSAETTAGIANLF